MSLDTSAVSKIFGSVALGGERDLDFTLDSPLPIVWQRTYVSSNAFVGWLGQGWSLPWSHRLEFVTGGVDFIDVQGRRAAFPELAVGGSFLSRYDQTTLVRTGRHAYELVSPEGLRFVFGPAPSDLAVIDAATAVEEAQRRHFEAALARRVGSIEDAATVPAPHGIPEQHVEALVLLGLVDPNGHWLRVHYAAIDRPQVIETSDGRHVGLVFHEADDPDAVRLHQVLLLHGSPDATGRFAGSEVLIEYRYTDGGDLAAVVDEGKAVVREFAWASHLMVAESEPGGGWSRYEWDQLSPQGRVVREEQAGGDVLAFHYDLLARQNSVTDASRRTTVYRYDEQNRYIGFTNAQGESTRFDLDRFGQRASTSDPMGRITRYDRDLAGNLVRLQQPDGSTFAMAYDAARRMTAITDPLGRTTRYAYDGHGNLAETVSPDGATTRYELDARGWPVRIIDAHGGISQLDYDASGRLLTYRDCVGSMTGYAYDAEGNLIRMTDALDHVTHYRYERINRRYRLVAVTAPDGAVERFAYDTLGRLVAHHDAVGAATRYTLAPSGRPTLREDALGHTLRYQYDAHERLLALTNENGAVYRFAWDRADRLAAELGFDGRRQDYGYNAAGELVEAADGVPDSAPLLAAGVPGVLRVRFQRDALGRMLGKTSIKPQPAGKSVLSEQRYRYDAAGQLIEARNRCSRVEFHHTPTGQLAREISRTRGGLTATVAHAYDFLGNRVSTVLPDGRKLAYTIYGSRHVQRVSLDGETLCEFERDRLHRETVRTQGALRTYFDRNAVGRLVASQVKGATAGSAAPDAVRLARHYHYDRSGQLLAVDDLRQGRTLYRYDAAGRLLAAQSNHAKEWFAFDPAGNLVDPAAGADKTAADGERRTWTESEWEAYVRERIGDADFNPLLTPDDVATDPSRWGAVKPNRLVVHQEHRYRYDVWGNVVEKRSGAHEVRALEWDAEHQLMRAHITRRERGQLVIEHWGYDYDALGRRVAKFRLPAPEASNEPHYRAHQTAQSKRGRAQADRARHHPGSTHFAWDGHRLLEERQGERRTAYVYERRSFTPLVVLRSTERKAEREEAPVLPLELRGLKDQYPEQWAAVAQKHQRLLAKMGAVHIETPVPSKPEVFYVHADRLGTPRELTDSDGALVWAATYKAWGSALVEHPPLRRLSVEGSAVAETWEAQADPVVLNLRFPGQYFDAETGLHYNRFRHYDADIGRFVSQDPIGLQGGVHLYRYAPNPTGFVDPLGLSSKRLRDALRMKKGDCHQAHHLIPEEVMDDADFKPMFDRLKSMGFDPDGAGNGIALPGN